MVNYWVPSTYQPIFYPSFQSDEPPDKVPNVKRSKNIMLLLTKCEVHTGKYSDRSFEVLTERSEVCTKN